MLEHLAKLDELLARYNYACRLEVKALSDLELARPKLEGYLGVLEHERRDNDRHSPSLEQLDFLKKMGTASSHFTSKVATLKLATTAMLDARKELISFLYQHDDDEQTESMKQLCIEVDKRFSKEWHNGK